MTDEARESNEPPPPRGVLRASPPDGLLEGRRVLPSAKLAHHIHHFWFVRWALRSPFIGEALPHPSAQIITRVNAAARRRTEVLGVQTGRLARRLAGQGRIFGITFRPVMFQPLLGGPMKDLTDRIVPLERVLGAKVRAWTRALQEACDLEHEIAITEAFLGPLLPPVSPQVARLRDLVERMATDRSILRVADVSAASNLGRRVLERSFRIYVGASPKWVILRYRLQEAVAELRGPSPPTLAALAASLGYADQAHFGRDFRRAVGETPRTFGRSSGVRRVTPAP